MDQIRAAFGWLKEHHFWVLAVLVLGLSIGGWYMGAASLTAQYKSDKSKIDGEFSSQSNLRNKPFKPNDVINRRQQEETRKLALEVEQVWDALYERQTEKVLKWPEALGGAFIKSMEGKQFGDKILDRHRQRYLDYIEKRFPKLLKIVDAEDLGEEGSGRGGRRGPPRGLSELGGYPGGPRGRPGAAGEDLPEQPSHLVDWLDQSTLRSRLALTKRPDSLEVWVLQEDLWVYEALLGAIAATNEATGATRQNRAAVRVIEQLQVGQAAAGANNSTGRLLVPEVGGSSIAGGGMMGGYPGMMGGYPGMGEGGMMGGYPGGEGGMMGGYPGGEGGFPGGGYPGGFPGEGGAMGGDGDLGQVLLAGRYLSDDGEPITDVPPDYSFGREYKRLPVRMVLEMDHRWLTHLLLELANAPLQVEVEQVRINPGDVSSGSTRRRSSAGEVEAFQRNPNVGTVVLQGAVYMFNAPDKEVLSTGDEEDPAI